MLGLDNEGVNGTRSCIGKANSLACKVCLSLDYIHSGEILCYTHTEYVFMGMGNAVSVQVLID